MNCLSFTEVTRDQKSWGEKCSVEIALNISFACTAEKLMIPACDHLITGWCGELQDFEGQIVFQPSRAPFLSVAYSFSFLTFLKCKDRSHLMEFAGTGRGPLSLWPWFADPWYGERNLWLGVLRFGCRTLVPFLHLGLSSGPQNKGSGQSSPRFQFLFVN